MAKLTTKQQVFIEHYLETWNATEAARRAGYRGNYDTLKAVGYENLTKPHLRERIQERLREKALSADEVLARLSEQARNSIADFIEPVPGRSRAFMLNMDEIKARGHLIKKIKMTINGPEIELYDGQAALNLMGKHFALFTDRIEVHDWRSKIVDALRAGRLEPEQVRNEFGDDLATELFDAAGIRIGSR